MPSMEASSNGANRIGELPLPLLSIRAWLSNKGATECDGDWPGGGRGPLVGKSVSVYRTAEEASGEVAISGGLIDLGPAARPPPRGHNVGEGHALSLGDAEEVDDGDPTSSCSRYNEAGDIEADPTASATRECEPLLARGGTVVVGPATAPQHAPARGGDVLITAKSCCCCGSSGGLLSPAPPPLLPLDLERGECESELIVRSIASDMA